MFIRRRDADAKIESQWIKDIERISVVAVKNSAEILFSNTIASKLVKRPPQISMHVAPVLVFA